MEKNKYYTPEIEEFHIGFEFEEYIPGTNTEYSKQEYYTTSHFNMMYNTYSNNLQEGWARVKYLDQSDIESLGFEFTINPDFDFISKVQYDDTRGKVYYKILLSFGVKGPWVRVQANRTTLFAGHVKNKSELKRILKQIGYEKVD